MKRKNPVRIAVDIGGTFTDIALARGDSLHTAKTLTTADDPVRGVVDVIRIAMRDSACAAADHVPSRRREGTRQNPRLSTPT